MKYPGQALQEVSGLPESFDSLCSLKTFSKSGNDKIRRKKKRTGKEKPSGLLDALIS